MGVAQNLGPYRITAATSFGPRITSFSVAGAGGLFASLSADVAIPAAPGVFRFHGGHRVWAAPEVPAVTYAPDDHACRVTGGPTSLTIVAPTDRAGLGKEMEVSLGDEALVVDHVLANRGSQEIRVAPWAITQLTLGGIALMPVGALPGGGDLRPDRSLVVWPYTRLDDPRLSWLGRTVVIRAEPGARLKLGAGPNPGRLGYLRDGWLFLKEVSPASDADAYPDRGATGQVFTDADFCELESVGPLRTLAPGDRVGHREVWRLVPCSDLAAALEQIAGMSQ